MAYMEESDDLYKEIMEEDYSRQEEMADTIAYLTNTDEDTMYLNQAMEQPDKAKFFRDITKGVNNHRKKKHHDFSRKEEVSERDPILDLVWAMEQKRNINTRRV